jgi:hypothetical protein
VLSVPHLDHHNCHVFVDVVDQAKVADTQTKQAFLTLYLDDAARARLTPQALQRLKYARLCRVIELFQLLGGGLGDDDLPRHAFRPDLSA